MSIVNVIHINIFLMHVALFLKRFSSSHVPQNDGLVDLHANHRYQRIFVVCRYTFVYF